MADDFYHELCSIEAQIGEYRNMILKATLEQKNDVLLELFKYYKKATFDLEQIGGPLPMICPIASKIENMISLMPSESIIAIKPYDFSDERIITNPQDIGQILDALVYEERCRLYAGAQKLGYKSFEDYDPYCDCRLSALSIYNMAKLIGLDAKVKIIEPGYLYESPLYGGGCKHVVVLIKHRAKYYLVDVTYKQFFMQKRCNLDKLGSPYLANPNPGTFMVMNDSRRKTAEDLLNNGWIELDFENMKNYFDGFTMFYRNGLYYENTQDFTYETEYGFLDYFNFLNGLDNQTKHEGYETLGYQTIALKNPNMVFDRR